MATEPPDGQADRVEVIFEPGVSSKWLLQLSIFANADSAEAHATYRSVVATTLAVEEAIAHRVEELAAAVARVVHTFGGRDIHLRDGSRIEYRWELIGCDWRCLDCGVDTDALDEYYMLHNDLWAQANPNIAGNLCIGCLENRLGRTLTTEDFADAQVNNPAKFRRSARLRDRLDAQSPR